MWRRPAGGRFVTLCAVIALSTMIGVGARLSLDAAGFTCRTPGRRFHCCWVECSAFTPVLPGGRPVVGFSTAQDECAHPKLAGVALAIIGQAGALTDTFGFSADDLADLIHRFGGSPLASGPD